jgi:putative addiction module component (TIGR02574 family)
MRHRPIDLTTLTPLERIALADALYDSAMREIEADAARLSADQLADLDRRIADVEDGRIDLARWEDVRQAG